MNKKLSSIIENIIHKKNSEYFPWGVMLLFGLIYFTIVICNHYFFRTNAFDYGAYNFAFYDYAHFRISDSPVYLIPHMSFLQDHVSFTFFFFIPLYWIFSWLTGTYTLLLIQTSIILYGAWAVYKLLLLKTNSQLLSILALIQYCILLGRWTSFLTDCNLAIIASSLIPVLWLYIEKKDIVPSIIIFFFILFTREDMALWLAFIGLFFLVSNFKDKWTRYTAIGIIVFSLIYFILVFTVIIPMLETPYKKFSLFNYTALGSGPYEAFVYILKHPIDSIKLLFINTTGDSTFDGVKSEFYIYYLLCGGVLLFVRPKYFLLIIPLLAKKMFNDDPVRWSNQSYYSIEFVSILPIIIFLIISEFKSKKIRNISIVAVCLCTIILTIHYMDSSNRKLNWWGDKKYAFYKKSMYKSDFDIGMVNKNLKLIPDNAKISATGSLLTHMAFRPKIYFYPRLDDAEYLIVLLKNDTYPLNKAQFDTIINKQLKSKYWQLIVYNYPFCIAHKKDLVYNNAIKEKINQIHNDEKWLNDVKAKAIKEGISTDSMIYLDAKWVIDNENN